MPTMSWSFTSISCSIRPSPSSTSTTSSKVDSRFRLHIRGEVADAGVHPQGGRSDRGRGRRLSALEHELAVVRVDADGVALGEVALEQAQRERVLDDALDRALERAGAVGRIPALLRERFLRRFRQLELETPLREPLA